MDFEIMYQKVRQMLDSKEVSLRETAVFWRDRHKEDPADPIYKALYDQKLGEWSVVQDLISQIDGWIDEILDLKLENDRLKQREDLLLKAVKSIGCAYNTCHGCLYENGETCGSYAEYTRLCRHVLEELEEL